MAKPLVIAVHTDLYHLPWVEALRAKGHTITDGMTPMEIWKADLILAPQACRWVEGMQQHLDALIKGARAIKYPAKPKPSLELAPPPIVRVTSYTTDEF